MVTVIGTVAPSSLRQRPARQSVVFLHRVKQRLVMYEMDADGARRWTAGWPNKSLTVDPFPVLGATAKAVVLFNSGLGSPTRPQCPCRPPVASPAPPYSVGQVWIHTNHTNTQMTAIRRSTRPPNVERVHMGTWEAGGPDAISHLCVYAQSLLRPSLDETTNPVHTCHAVICDKY